MGSAPSVLTEEEKRILRNPQQGQASELYWACRNGDVEVVRKLIKTIPYEDLNLLELNGSTALHAAVHGGHAEIVRILLNERGCRRDRPNLHGLTAYQEAQTAQIRELFHRPGGNNRFCDENEENSLALFKVSESKDLEDHYTSDEDFEKDGYLEGHATAEDMKKVRKEQGAGKMLCQSTVTRMLRFNTGPMYLYREYLENQLHDYIPDNHTEKKKSKSLCEKAFEEENPLFLLRLYTLETPFYREIGCHTGPLLGPLEDLSTKLKSRYFQGTTYRGLKMTTEDLRPYRWSLKKKSAIETKTFCSTSLNRKVAQSFAESSKSGNDKRKVLMVFQFPKRTEQAINLGKISDKEPCISEYEDEAEVLVFPETLFFVKEIDTDSNGIIIYLEHIIIKRSSLIRGVKDLYDIIKHEKKTELA